MTPSQTKVDKNSLPRIGITIGDIAGIGPEITVKAVADSEIRKICVPVIFGDAKLLERVCQSSNVPFDYEVVPSNSKVAQIFFTPTIIDFKNAPANLRIGFDSQETGAACAEYIISATNFLSDNRLDAMATAPISKRALSLAGYKFPGHTEFIADLTNTKKFAMSFFAAKLCVVLLSTHLSLRDAIEQVRTESIEELIVFVDKCLSKLFNKRVRIAVAGLNPHASEGGMFGNEEANEILPAINSCKENFGIDVSGPYSPDTIFLRGYRGEFDAVLACYHDQATIAVKSLSFGAAVNVTLGLPFVRTSVDHGTALDIAGKNRSDPSSMKQAIMLAARLA